MRRAAKIDANQPEIVDALRRMGASVEITSGAHDGFTDLVVGAQGITVLVEVKDGSLSPSRRTLTPVQQLVHGRFKGAITVVETIEQAHELISRMRMAGARLAGIDWHMGAVANAGTETKADAKHGSRVDG